MSMWLAIYVNTFRGQIRPYGPFESEADAQGYISRRSDPSLWYAAEINRPKEKRAA